MKLLLLFSSIIILTLFFLHPTDSDGDFYQHLNIGKYVWENRSLPRVDNLTFTAASRPYVGYSWGAGVIYYLLYTNFGALAINFLGLIIGILTIVLLYLLLKSLKINTGSIIITFVIALPLIAGRWPTRPEIFIYPIFLSALLIDDRRMQHPLLVLLYPVLTLILVNIYGSSAPGFLLLLSLLLVKQLVKDVIRQGGMSLRSGSVGEAISSKIRLPRRPADGETPRNDTDSKVLFYPTVFLSIPLAFLNGYGADSVFFIGKVHLMTKIWGDWEGIISILTASNFFNFSIISLWPYFSYLLLFAILFVFSIKNSLRSPFWGLLSLSILVPLIALRLTTLAVILSAPFFAILLSKISIKHRWIQAITALIGIISSVWFVLSYPPGIGGNDYYFPPQLISFIQKHSLSGRAFNTQRVGSFLEHHLFPQVKTLSDTRDDLFIGSGVLEDLQAFVGSKASSLYLLRKYKIDLVIINLSDGIGFRDLLHSDDWSLVYFDGNYLIFVPQSVAKDKNLPKLQVSDPFI